MVICVQASTTHSDFLTTRIPNQNIRIVDTFDNVLQDEQCNVIADEAYRIADHLRLASPGSNETIVVGSNAFTREPLAMVTRSDDYEWTLFVETVFQGLLEAEARNITQERSIDFGDIPYFGSGYNRTVAQAVGRVGNFGRVYDREIGSELKRLGLNRLRRNNCEEGGLIYGFPFGNILEGDPRDNGSGKLAEIVNRTRMRCGVPSMSESLGQYMFNVEICNAISAAIFGSVGHVDLVKVPPSTESFDKLLSDEVDVLTGAGSGLLPLLGRGLQDLFFSRPYFFSPLDDGTHEAFLLMTKSDDHQWSMFVQWIIDSVILAEEIYISRSQGKFLPEVKLFGPSYDQMFRDVISAVGNYGEMYNRTMNVSRSGCNQLNIAPHGPQHFPFLFQGL
jgi:hypothetical protein